MRSVFEIRIGRAAQFAFERVFANPPVEFLLGKAAHCLSRIPPGEQLQEGSPVLFKIGSVCLNRHAVGQWRRAGWHWPVPGLDVDKTRSARARGSQPLIVTKRGYTNPELLKSSQNGCAFLNLTGGAVDHDPKHFGVFQQLPFQPQIGTTPR